MEMADVEYGMGKIAAGGNCLNCQELLGLEAGLTVLKAKEKYRDIYFWGKIFGQTNDYYVAYTLDESEFEFPSKAYFFSTEEFDFAPLPRLTEKVADQIIDLKIEMPLTGVPSTPLEGGAAGDEEAPPDGGDEDGGEEQADKPPKLTELDRLAQIVQEIDFDTAVVPKGAYALNEAHTVVPSNDFKGLGLTQAASLQEYVHFRPPASVAALRALARTDIQFYSNFLDPLEGDLPKGCWVVRQDPSVALVTLRSLNWPGYIAFHVPGTKRFGGLYFGWAQKNQDLPFIM